MRMRARLRDGRVVVFEFLIALSVIKTTSPHLTYHPPRLPQQPHLPHTSPSTYIMDTLKGLIGQEQKEPSMWDELNNQCSLTIQQV